MLGALFFKKKRTTPAVLINCLSKCNHWQSVYRCQGTKNPLSPKVPIDGFKIDLPYLNGPEWLENDYLEFFTPASVKTGELKENTLEARYKGLVFTIKASTTLENRNYYQVRGSLHKYFNDGEHNYNDFTLGNLQTVIVDLQEKFSIVPETTILRNLEFGVNIKSLITVKAILKNIIAHGSDTFGSLKIDGVDVGKFLGKQQYRVKIYDKGKQYKRPDKDLVRIEIAVKKMHYLQSYGITTLSDVLNQTRIKPLGNLLISFWENIIYYDKKINWKALSEFERKKVLYYAAPRNWSDFEKKQRYRAKKHFQNIKTKYGDENSQEKIKNLIAQKWEDIAANICPPFNQLISESESIDLSTNYPLEYPVNKYPSFPTSNIQNIDNNLLAKVGGNFKRKELTNNQSKCRTCKKDISRKKPGTMFCSKKCNNSFQAKRRKKKRRQKTTAENKALNQILKILPNSQLMLIITYKEKNSNYPVEVVQQLLNIPEEDIRLIQSVKLKHSGKVVLTSYRARKLIKTIVELNRNEVTTK